MIRTLFIFKEGREGRLLSFCLEPFNMNTVLVICNINKLFICDKPVINVEEVVIQGRLNGVDIAIQISQMGIINMHSLFKMKQTVG